MQIKFMLLNSFLIVAKFTLDSKPKQIRQQRINPLRTQLHTEILLMIDFARHPRSTVARVSAMGTPLRCEQCASLH